jgi:hypothetical protein
VTEKQKDTAATQIALRDDQQPPLAPMSLGDLGNILATSGYFADARQAAQAMVKVLAGRELGIGPISAMTGIYIVSGKVTLSANLIAGCIKRSNRYTYRVVELTDQRCELEFSENAKIAGTSTFAMADALRAGLTTGKNAHSYQHYPKNMLFSRAISNGAKWYCPDIFAGPPYTPEELGMSVNCDGEVIEAEAEVLTPEQMAKRAEKEKLAAAVASTVANPTSAPSAGGTAAPAAAGAVTSTAAGQNLASDVQVSEITVAIQALELKGQPAGMCQKRGVSRLEELTRAQADEILTTLRAKVQARKAELDKQLAEAEKEKPANPTTVSTPTGNGSSNSGPASAPHSPATVGVENSPIPERPDQVGSILPDDEKRILAYCHKLMLGDADLARILAKRMQGNPPHPTRCVADLTYTHSQEIIANLRAALLKRFPEASPF